MGMTMAVLSRTRFVLLTGLIIVAPLIAADDVGPPPRVDLTIGRDTTYVDGPVRPDGTIDYTAVILARCGKGITPDNNAATLLLKALGKSFVAEDRVDEALRLTGLAAMPDEDATFVSFEDYARRHAPESEKDVEDPVWLQHIEAMEGPWAADDLPLVAAWLAANDKALALLTEASKRPRFFFLLTPSEEDAVVRLPRLRPLVDAKKALQCRAMLKLDDGDVEGALADLMNLHRLGRLVAGGGTLIEWLVGVNLDGVAAAADQWAIADRRLTPAQARRYAEALRRLPALPPVGTIVDEVERCFGLCWVMSLTDPQGVERFANGPGASMVRLPDPREHRLLLDAGVDWDAVLRQVNRDFDRMVAVMAIDDAAARAKANDAMKAEKDRQQSRVRRILDEDLPAFCRLAAQGGGDRAQLRRQATEIMTAFAVSDASGFDVPITRAREISDQGATAHQLILLALALDIARAEHGQYPQNLESLMGRYIESLPVDPFSGKGKALIYRREGEGYVLYSVGWNLRDDGGRSSEDGADFDDIVVRVVRE